MIAHGDQGSFGATGQQEIEALDEAIAEIGVMSQLRESERAVPRSNFAIEDCARAVLVRAHHEVLGQALANFLRRATRRPAAEVVLLTSGPNASPDPARATTRVTPERRPPA